MHSLPYFATAFAQELFKGDQYSDYLYFHGLGVQMAEALAEWVHARIRSELGFADPAGILSWRDCLIKYQTGGVLMKPMTFRGPAGRWSLLSPFATR